MNSDSLLIMPSFSLQPNKLVGFNSIFRRDYNNELLVPIQSKRKLDNSEVALSSHSKVSKLYPGQTDLFIKPTFNVNNWINHTKVESKVDNLKADRTELVLSDNAYRTLQKKINWLYYLSKSRYRKTYSGKEIFNFKINFITLTLPSKQKKPTVDCNNQLLNHFLTEIRQRTKMENYVWRLEFQDNGNAHWHIVSDTYLDYFFIRKVWNRILKLNGYIDDYKRKHESMSLYEYNKTYNPGGKIEFNKMAKRYADGKANKWEQPNSVDVKSVISKKAISNYISKYFSKGSDNKIKKNELDNADNIKNVRLWFCSRSLSKLNTVSNFMDAVEYNLFTMIENVKDAFKLIRRYATIIYFEITKIEGSVRKFIEMLLKDYSRRQGYIPAS